MAMTSHLQAIQSGFYCDVNIAERAPKLLANLQPAFPAASVGADPGGRWNAIQTIQ